MIKFVQCVRRKPEVSVVEFRSHWRQYREKLVQIAEALDAVRCAECMTLAVEANLDVMLRRGTSEPFDALAELWVDNAAAVAGKLESDHVRALMMEFQALQSEFIDLSRSSFFFTSESVVYER